MKEARIKILKDIEEYLINNCDENIFYDIWRADGLPDDYTEEDIEYIAGDDELWQIAISAFDKCCRLSD
jgi:hypothetical protein